MISEGKELLAVTEAAVQPLLVRGGETGHSGDDTTHAIFSPLVDTSRVFASSLPPGHTPPGHTPHGVPPPPPDTPSPLTITAREVESGCLDERGGGGGGRQGGGGSSDGSLSPMVSGTDTPPRNITSLPSWGTPHSTMSTPHTSTITPTTTPHHYNTTPIPGAGIKIKISAKKVREVASPLSSPRGPQHPKFTVPLSPLLHDESTSTTGGQGTPPALSPLLSPPPPSSPLPHPSPPHPPPPHSSLTTVDTDIRPLSNKADREPMKTEQHQNRGLAQGVLRNASSPPSVDTSLENSVIVHQMESTVPTHNIKERLLQQQPLEKQVKFKVVHPQIIRQQQQQLRENRARKKPVPSISPPQTTAAVGGGGRDANHSIYSSQINKQHDPRTDVRPLPASSLPPRYSLALAAANQTIPANPSPSNSLASNTSEFPLTPTASRCHPKQFPHVSFRKDHARASQSGTTAHGSCATLGSDAAASSASVLPQQGVTLPAPPTLDRSRLNFAETVQLVASCTAAATAAALTSQKGYEDENKAVQVGKSFSNITSKRAAFDRLMSNVQPATVPRLFSGDNGIAPADHVSPHSYTKCTADHREGGEVGGSADVFSTAYPQAKTTAETLGAKVPQLEKTTCQFTVVPEISHTRWGLGQESKQPPLLCNQTPHATIHAETQNNNNYHSKWQTTSPHPSGIRVTQEDKNKDEVTESRDVNGLPNVGCAVGRSKTHHHSEMVNTGSCLAEQRALFEVENMLMEVQQARKDLETHSALAEVQEGWSDPTPLISTDSHSQLDTPEHRVAVFLSQLREKSATTTHEEEIESGKRAEKVPHSRESQASTREGRGGQRGNVIHPEDSVRNGRGNSQNLTAKGKLPPRSSTWKTKQAAKKFDKGVRLAKLGQKTWKSKRVNEDSGDTTDTGVQPPQQESTSDTQWQMPLPSLPLLHNQVLAPMNGHPCIPVAGYTLPYGMVVRDPSTGMPLLGSALSNTATVPLPTVVPPPPPCIHMPTAIPLGPPSTTPSQLRPVTVNLAPSTEPLPHVHDAITPSRVSVADVCLQTSFSGNTFPHLVQEVLPVVNISTNTESLSKISTTCDDHIVQSPTADNEAENLHDESSSGIVGISLVGRQAGLSPSGPPNDPPFPAALPRREKEDAEVSAEEMDQRINQHLQTQTLQWVTRELVTRAMAAAEQSRDMSCDGGAESRLDDSPNSCSTCTLPHRTFTSALPPRDISMANGTEDHLFSGASVHGGSVRCVNSAAGECVRSEEVEVVVREVIREKVMEAVRELQAGRREEGETTLERCHAEEREDASSTDSRKDYSSDSVQATPLIPTPSPSPPPSHSSPPSPTSQSTSPLLSRPQIATPTATPSLSRKSDSTSASPSSTLSTPQETEDEVSAVVREETAGGGEREDSTSLPHPTLSTPPPSPPHQAPPTPSPPSLTKEDESTPSTPSEPPSAPPSLVHPTPIQPHQVSLSESSTSSSSTTSTEAHTHPHTLTTVTNLTTDQEISMGECLLIRPPLPGVTDSLSEGEVALSPGDARWYATYATKMGKWGAQGRETDSKTNQPKLSPVVAAFLDLKNSPDSLCDSSDYSSNRSSSIVSSAGEAKAKQRRGGGDAFDRFLANLQSSGPETSSTPTPPSSGDNTLSDMPSIAADDTVSRGEVKETTNSKWPRTAKPAGISVPYHKRFPLKEGKAASPGEVRSNPPSGLAEGGVKRRKKKSNISVSFARSEGEVHQTVQKRTDKRKDRDKKRPLPTVASASSPGELRIKLSTDNELRDGIDVIRISNSSPNSYSSFSTKQISHSPKMALHTPSSPSPVQPPARLRVRGEMGPARLVAVTSSPTAHGSKEKDDVIKEEDDVITIGGTQSRVAERVQPDLSTVVRTSLSPDFSPDATRLPGLDDLLQTLSSSSPGTSPPMPLPEQLPESKDLVEENLEEGHQSPLSPPPRLQLHSFWDTQSPRTPYVPTSQRTQETLAPPLPLGGGQTRLRLAEGKETHTTQTHTTLLLGIPEVHTPDSDDVIARPEGATAKSVVVDDVKDMRADYTINPLPTKTRLNISVPTATTVEESTSPTLSPTFSSEFNFSSISQPTFD